tara:strand:+ start:376 stop:552 length:177 start_codon:yes stop_codon:yes gene_type:complete
MPQPNTAALELRARPVWYRPKLARAIGIRHSLHRSRRLDHVFSVGLPIGGEVDTAGIG